MKHLTILFVHLFVFTLWADEPDAKTTFEFTEVTKPALHTSVKHQFKTNTCWSFATTSFIEAELMRLGKGSHNLSEMFFVRHTYPQKAKNYMRLHGFTKLGGGSLAQDVLRVVRLYGMVADTIYNGNKLPGRKHNHQEMDAALKGFMDAVIKNKSKRINPAWESAFAGILDAYLGPLPTDHIYQGKKYTPRTFADQIGFNPDDYIEFTSFLHYPYYKKMRLEVPDNWAGNLSWNLPLDEFIQVLNAALEAGYSVVWDGDTSEKSFKSNLGVAFLPKKLWENRSKAEQKAIGKNPEEELQVTAEIRQMGFDNYTTQDNHLMHVVGISKDQNDTLYYLTKNSWGSQKGPYKGYIYMSESYVRSKMLTFMVHKDAIAKTLLNKLK